ncbi:MAG: SRPBCC family protein [Pseudomonadota bacterium]
MQVKLEKTFPIAAPADAGWRVLQDIKGVAECMPGAQITQQIDATHYKGQVKMRLGPATASFNGELKIKSIDEGERKIELFGKGSDTSGASAATMNLTAQVRDGGDGRCEVIGVSDITVSGKLASFGGRMLTQVSEQILKQFGDNFTARVLASARGADTPQTMAASVPPPKELNGVALAWNVVLGFFKSLFGDTKSKSG